MQQFLLWNLPGWKWCYLDYHSGVITTAFFGVAIAGVVAVASAFTVFDAFAFDIILASSVLFRHSFKKLYRLCILFLLFPFFFCMLLSFFSSSKIEIGYGVFMSSDTIDSSADVLLFVGSRL